MGHTGSEDDNGSHKKTPPRTPETFLANMPSVILRRIFAIVSTQSYAARRTIPLVCKAFHAVTASECPEMWDTFEVMTGNEGALTGRHQVEYVARKAMSAPLSIGLTISMSRVGAWTSDALDMPLPGEEGPTLEMHAVDMVETISTLMPRVHNLILDVQDDPLDVDLTRAVLALFDDERAGRVRRVTFLGDYQLDRIVRLTTPLTTAPSLLQPALTSLRHVALAYCTTYQLPGPLLGIETLEANMLTLDTSSSPYPLQQLLLGFPNLQRLEIRTTIDGMAPHELPTLGLGLTAQTREKPPKVVLHNLKAITLEALPLTSSLLSSLVAPNLETLELREFIVGFDPRDVRFELSLAEHIRALDKPGSPTTTPSSLEPLPFGTFLARHAQCGSLRSVTLGEIPSMAVRMCVDFVKGGGTSGLTRLSLLGFEWRDWASLFSQPETNSTPTPAETGSFSPLLPRLHSLHVFLDHASTWAGRGTVSFDPEAKSDREGWMGGLMGFAERRMDPRAVVRMLRESKMEMAEEWLRARGERGDEDEDPLRTVMSVELDAGYKDSYAFVHGAWKAMERERGGGMAGGREEVVGDVS